jgi:hypothetical protein
LEQKFGGHNDKHSGASTRKIIAATLSALVILGGSAQAQDCSVTPMIFNSHVANLEGEMTVKAGKGCGFGLNGIQGAITEAAIVQKPKAGMAGVRALCPFMWPNPVIRDQTSSPMRSSERTSMAA